MCDPPYAQEVEDGNRANEVRDNDFGFSAMTEDLRNRTARAIAQQTRRWALVFCSVEEAYLWRFALIAAGMSYYRTGFWVRQGGAPQMNGLGPAQGVEAIVIAHSRVLTQRWNGGGKQGVWYAPIVRTDRCHPTQKPVSLLRQLIEDFTDEGEVIADPFAGVASMGVAAVGLGRRYVGWELSEEHYRNGIRRLEMPLFDHISKAEQIEIGGPEKPSVRRRMELERKILVAIEATQHEGMQTSGLAELISEASTRQIQRSLKRLQKTGAIVRQGRTSQTRWYSATTPPPQGTTHESPRASADP
jgi:site-specific DNA-methyltransferase (adenine-specific)